MWPMLAACMPLAAASRWDVKTRTIPSKWMVLLFCCGGLRALLAHTWWTAILGALVCGFPVLCVSITLTRGYIGGGDVKLCAALGLLLGPVDGYMVILLALIFLSAYGLLRRKMELPFAPFVFPAYIVVLLIF